MSFWHAFAQGWLAWLWAASWQVALLVVLVALAAWAARRQSARFRHALWMLVLLKIFLWPGLAAPWSLGNWATPPMGERLAEFAGPTLPPLPFEPAESEEASAPAERDAMAVEAAVPADRSAAPLARASFTPAHWLMMAWLSGALFFLGYVLARYAHVLSLLRRVQPVEEGPLRVALERLALQLGRDAPPELLLSDRFASPFLLGLAHPRIVVPADLARRLKGAELEDVLLHELIHWRRRDLWLGWLQVVAQALFWFHPLVWWANAQLRHERECACDEEVLAAGRRSADDYAESLVRVLLAARGQSSAALGFLGIFERDTKLQIRLGNIMNQDRRIRRFGLGQWMLIILFGLLTLPMAAQPESSRKDPVKPEHWIRVVVDVGRMTIEGYPLTREDLPKALAHVANRPTTVLEFAVATPALTDPLVAPIKNDLIALAGQLGFAYLSDIGVHAIESYGVLNTPDVPKLIREIKLDISHPLSIEDAVKAICEADGIAYDGKASAKLDVAVLHKSRDSLQLSGVTAEQALLEVLKPTGLRFDLGQDGLYLLDREQHLASIQATSAAPRIVQTSPAIGAEEVDPALVEITVTFDRDMNTGGFSWTGGGPEFPKNAEGQKPHWIDKRTCALPVALEAASYYRVGLNSTSHRNFRSAEGVPLAPAFINFTTRGAPDELKQKLHAPKIVTMEPAHGAKDVDPAITELRVTFDVPMGGDCSWTGGGDNYPTIPEGQRPRWSEDGKTCMLPVALKPGWTYRLGLNSPSHKNFQSAAGVPLEPVSYTFSTRP